MSDAPLIANLRGSLFSARGSSAGQFLAHVMPQIPEAAPIRILDLGCGVGETANAIAHQRPLSEVVGVDLSEANIAMARQHFPSIAFMADDYLITDLEPFDIIIADGVLYLLSIRDDVLAQKLAHDLRPGGILLATLPIRSAVNRMRSLQRSAWRLLPASIDRAALVLASMIYPAESRTLLAERVVYLRVPPTRYFDGSFTAAMRMAGIDLMETIPMPAPSFVNLTAVFSRWHKRL